MEEHVWMVCDVAEALSEMRKGESVLFRRDSWRKWVRSSVIVHQHISVQELPSMRWAKPVRHPLPESVSGCIRESETTIHLKEAM